MADCKNSEYKAEITVDSGEICLFKGTIDFENGQIRFQDTIIRYQKSGLIIQKPEYTLNLTQNTKTDFIISTPYGDIPASAFCSLYKSDIFKFGKKSRIEIICTYTLIYGAESFIHNLKIKAIPY